jgi:ribosomal protein S6--L-glutamate ligase
VLSRKRSLYTTRRLLEAARSAGHDADAADPLACWLVCGERAPHIYYKSDRRKVSEVDVVLPRIGSSITDYGLAVVNQFEMMEIPVVNSSAAIRRSRDKLRTLQFLSRHDIDIPKTVIARGPGQIQAALRVVGGPPVVLKLLQGTQGIGVMLAETLEGLESILHTVWSLGHNLLIQEFVAESRGRDIRALVVGGRVVAAMKRIAPLGEFRSNIHRGGSGRLVHLSPEYERVAVESARIMELDVAGVDLLESRRGPKVIEINSSPGFEGLEKATGADIAGAIVQHTVARGHERDRCLPALRS